MDEKTDETLCSAFADLIPKEKYVGHTLKEFTAPNGRNHFFINSKTPMIVSLHFYAN